VSTVDYYRTVKLLIYYQPKFGKLLWPCYVEKEETKLNWGYTHACMINYQNRLLIVVWGQTRA